MAMLKGTRLSTPGCASMMTDAELTILSLVAEGPRYGYEIQQVIDERGLREWLTIGFSSIYYILNKLERQSLITSEMRPEGRGPARKVYVITPAGRGILQTAVADLLRQPRSLGSGFELGLVNLNALKPRQVFQVLSHHQFDLRQRVEAVEKAWQRNQEDKEDEDNISALYTHSLAIMRAELDWLNGFLDDWRARYPAVDEPEDKPEGDDPREAITRANPRTSRSEPAKMIQHLKRIPPRTEE